MHKEQQVDTRLKNFVKLCRIALLTFVTHWFVTIKLMCSKSIQSVVGGVFKVLKALFCRLSTDLSTESVENIQVHLNCWFDRLIEQNRNSLPKLLSTSTNPLAGINQYLGAALLKVSLWPVLSIKSHSSSKNKMGFAKMLSTLLWRKQ